MPWISNCNEHHQTHCVFEKIADSQNFYEQISFRQLYNLAYELVFFNWCPSNPECKWVVGLLMKRQCLDGSVLYEVCLRQLYRLVSTYMIPVH